MLLGYNTNGFAHHDAESAVRVISQLGYKAVGLTLDHHSLNPFEPDVYDAVAVEQLDRWRDLLQSIGLATVIETGARFLLNPLEKHEPTLVSPHQEQRARRVEFLSRAMFAANRLGAGALSLWSGVVHDGATRDEAFDRLVESMRTVLERAEEWRVTLGFEPEPGMLVATLDDYTELKQRLGAAGAPTRPLRLTLDIGHLHCNGELPIADRICAFAGEIVNVHIEDMRGGVHEHLMFGEGEIDFPAAIAALKSIGYKGVLGVELSRHSHMAPTAARAAYQFLAPLLE